MAELLGAGIAVDGTTEFVGVIGDPVAHTLSPLLHNAAYRALGRNVVYGAFRVPEGEVRTAIAGARSLGFLGLSVTTPHKVPAAMIADQRSVAVTRLGAANTVAFVGGVAFAESTDGDGLLDDLIFSGAFSPAGARCAIFGAGGAARSIVVALAAGGAREIVIINRTPSRAEETAALAPSCARVGALEDVHDCALVVNATSIGLSPPLASELGEVFASHLHPGQLAVDLVYHPARTPFLMAASAKGAQVRNGLGMLVHQAARQVELFTHDEAPVTAMWEAVEGRPTS